MFLLFKWKMCVGRESVVPIFAFLTAQNCELNAQGNLWREILEFWAVFVICLIHSGLRRLWFHNENNRNAKGPLLPSKRTPFALQNDPFYTPIAVVLRTWTATLAAERSLFAIKTGQSTLHPPTKTPPEISRIRFSFVILFYCHDNICILTTALPFIPPTFIKT